MKLRIRLRTLMLGVAVISVPCGWYAAHAYQRQREVAAIEQLQAKRQIVATRYLFEDTGIKHLLISDIDISLIDQTPYVLRPVTDMLVLEGFHRVNSLFVRSEVNSETIEAFTAFRQLKSILFHPDALDSLPTEELNSLVRFAQEHPKVIILLPERYFQCLTLEERKYFQPWN